MSKSMSNSSSPNIQDSRSTSSPSKVLGFLRKRSGTNHAGRENRSKSMAVSSGSDADLQSFESATKIQEPIRRQSQDSNQRSRINDPLLSNTVLHGVMRRKSLELGCFIDRRSSSIFNNSSHDSPSPPTSATHEQRPPLPIVPIKDGTELTRSSTPTGRRPTFSLSLPWRPQSEYFSSGSLPNPHGKLTKAQRKFIKAFPELADVITVPVAYCAPCMETSPPTPPETPSVSVSPSALSPSSTFATLMSSDSTSVSSTSTLTCRGHFNDFACALEREILWQGTLFITVTHICFYGKHFGKTVRVIVDYGDLVSIDKEKKMGVFPSSLRMRVRTPLQSRCAGESQTLKDYVFTSLISREQAFANIERNWNSRRQVMKNFLYPDLEQPDQQFDSIDQRPTRSVSISNMRELSTRAGSRHREGRPAPRSYSVISDEAFSSTENVDKPGRQERLPSFRTIAPLPLTISGRINGPQVEWEGWTVQQRISPENRRGSVASLASSSDKQDGSGIIGFLQRKQSSLRGSKRTLTPDHQPDTCSKEILDQRQEAIALSTGCMEIPADDVSFTSNVVDACSIQSEPCHMSTPSTTLISRPLTTTEVSQNQATSEPLHMNPLPSTTDRETTTMSATATMMRSNSNVSSGSQHSQHSVQLAPVGTIDNSMTPEYARTTVPIQPTRTLSVTLPAGPVECGCVRHYKHPVISSVIPMPLGLCFELLFSGMGAGQGDKLGCDTHRCKDGSTDIKITPWQSPSSLTPVDSIARKWSDEKRHLEYSVSFKVPMLAKTSTACFETQQVTEYSDFIILVHSESRTPNVPYGEHFSTVNQICMTWDSPGNTKIQCFTEVKFKKSIMWSGKVEAGSLEGSGGFYKELIRQLAELADSPEGAALVEKASKLNIKAVTATEVKLQRATKAVPSASSLSTMSTTATLLTEPAVSPLSITNEPATPIPIHGSISFLPSNATLTMEPVEMSRAQSLLSQQVLRSQAQPLILTLPLKSGTRASLNSGAGPKFEEASTNDSTLSTPENNSPVSTFIQSLTSPVLPVLGVVGNDQAVANSSASAPLIESPSTEPSTPALPVTPPSAQTLLELLKKSLVLFNKSPSATALPITPQSVSIDSSGSLGDLQPRTMALPLTSAHPRPSGNRVKFASTIYHTREAINNERYHNTQASTTKVLSGSALYNGAAHQDRSSRLLSKTLFCFLVMGMAITALNMWHLFGIVSSMVEAVHIKQELANHSMRTAFYTTPQRLSRTIYPMSPGMIQADGVKRRHRSTQLEFGAHHEDHVPPIRLSSLRSDSVPLLQEQTDLIRAEIVELFGLLDAARQELKHTRQ